MTAAGCKLPSLLWGDAWGGRIAGAESPGAPPIATLLHAGGGSRAAGHLL